MFVLDDMLGLRVRVTVGRCAGLVGTVIGQESKSRFLIQLDARHQQGVYLACESSMLENAEQGAEAN